MKTTSSLCIAALVFLASVMTIIAEDSFSVSADIRLSDKNTTVLDLSFSIPDQHHIYADTIKITTDANVELIPDKIPQAIKKYDKQTGENIVIYEHDVTLSYIVKGIKKNPIEIEVFYHGCTDTTCLMPTSKTFLLTPGNGIRSIRKTATNATAAMSLKEDAEWRNHFIIAGRSSGYLNVKKFIQFIDTTESGKTPSQDKLRSLFEQGNTWLCIILILIGGLALNLTPCVLPMIPINIAIIGAGAASKSKTRGFTLGAAYGIGMAMVYGMLGLMAVLTSSTFGSLSSSPLFNIIAAAVFVLLSLAMFDVISIDFSRFQGRAGGSTSGKGKLFSAFFLGAFSAVLAGACVAPVLISILLLSADLYAKGNMLGLTLPFILGLGMALPWPFIGAGLSFLPKPGKWMTHTKHVFGVIIFGLACYYGFLSYKLIAGKSQTHTESGWFDSLPNAFREALEKEKPVFIDFKSTGCKSCAAMDATTFLDQEVLKRLDKYVKIKFDTGNFKLSSVGSLLEDFSVKGFPTYLILTPTTCIGDKIETEEDTEILDTMIKKTGYKRKGE